MAENEIQPVEPGDGIARIDPDSPAGIMAQLMNNGSKGGFDVEGFGKMLEFQERHEANKARKAYASDFAVAQSNIAAAVKMKTNPQTNSQYADLESVLGTSRPVYTKQGFSIIYYEGETSKAENVRLCADVLHKSGHKETYHLDIPLDGTGIKGNVNMTKIHGKASSITYGRRYLICMIWNIPTQDDDGNAPGKKPAGVKPPTDEEQEAIDAICAKITTPEGKRVDAKKVAAICYEKEQGYPDMMLVDRVVAWFAKFGRPEIFIPENRGQFEIDNDMPGDEDSVPDNPEASEAEAAAEAKFGKGNDQVECRFLCNDCDYEYDNFLKIDQCPKCLRKNVLDRQEKV